MKFSIIGTGFILPSHIQAIRDVGGEIRDVVNDTRGQDAWKEMVAATDADCVVILTPNDLHVEMAMAVADRGKIVLCEKPLATTSEHCRTLASRANIFTVHQLRYHPLVSQIQTAMAQDRPNVVEMDISVYRDPEYYKSWKGMKERSGGPLFNLGVHYFDLLLYLFGPAETFKTTMLDERTGEGVIRNARMACTWRVSTGERRDNQRRVFRVNGKDYNFSSKDNLSFENLHRAVYEDLLKGKGITPQDALGAIELIENLYGTTQESSYSMQETAAQSVWAHPAAHIGNATIGGGTKAWHYSQVQDGAVVGKNCTIGHNCFVASGARLGNGVKLESNIDVWDLVTLEDDVFVGPSAVFTNDPTPRAKYPKKKYPQYGTWLPTLVREGASIGANATIMCGVTIGKWAMVGAGAVVTKNVPDYALVVGVPARRVGWVCECGNKLAFENARAACRACERNYQEKEDAIHEIS